MDDQPAPRMDFGDWILRWLDLVGECEKARGRMIDDDIKVAVMLKRPPRSATHKEFSFLRNSQWKSQRSVLLRVIQM